jgi:integrase
VFGHVRRCLVEYFRADKPLMEITPANAEAWRSWLPLPTSEGGQGLSDNTARRRCGIARQLFRVAVKNRLAGENPFADMEEGVGVLANRSRDYFVTRKEADAIIAACPNNEWKLLFALSRYGGLRCPSEHLALRWATCIGTPA